MRRWLTSADVDHTVRLEPLLRSFFFWLMEPDDLVRHLAQEVAFYSERAAQYRDYARRKDAGEFGTGPRVQSMRITVEGGIRVYEALADWARWAADYQLPVETSELPAETSEQSAGQPPTRPLDQ